MWHSWLEGLLRSSSWQPSRMMSRFDTMRAIRELAEAMASLERGSGMIAGVALDADRHTQMAPLLPEVRSTLAGWGAVLADLSPEDGHATFAQVCQDAGIATPKLPRNEPEAPVPEVEALRQEPSSRGRIAALAASLVAKGDPIGTYLEQVRMLENMTEGAEGWTELKETTRHFRDAHADELVALIWPPTMRSIAKAPGHIGFFRGLPTEVSGVHALVSAYSPEEWSAAPVAAVSVSLERGDKLNADLVRHPIFAKATHLRVRIGPRTRINLGPLFARSGPPFEDLDLSWSGTTLNHLHSMASPNALVALSLEPVEREDGFGRPTHLSASDVTDLAKLFPSLRSLRLYEVGLREDAAEALAASGWRLEVLDLQFSLAPAGVTSLASSPVLSRMKKLKIRGTPLDDRAASALASSPHLASLVTLSLNESMEDSMGAFVDAMNLPSLGLLEMLHAPAPSGIRERVPKDVALSVDEPK